MDELSTCKQCSKPFVVKGWDIKRGRGIFCGRQCYMDWRTEGKYSYHAIHTWLWRRYRHLKTGRCTSCSRPARTEWANVSGEYRKDINDYIELCKPCHERYDNKRHDNFKGRRHTEESKRRIGASVRRNRWGNKK